MHRSPRLDGARLPLFSHGNQLVRGWYSRASSAVTYRCLFSALTPERWGWGRSTSTSPSTMASDVAFIGRAATNCRAGHPLGGMGLTRRPTPRDVG